MPFGFIHPARVAEKVATVDVLSHGRVEWGTGRSTPMEQTAFGVPTDDRSRDQWQEAIEIVVRMWEQETVLLGQPEPAPSRSGSRRRSRSRTPPARLAGGRVARRARSPPESSVSGCCICSFCSRSRRWPTPSAPTGRAQAHGPTRGHAHPGQERPGRLSTRSCICYDDPDEAAGYGLWESVNWWYQNLAEFTLQWELARLPDRGESQGLPAPRAGHRRRGAGGALPRGGHDHHRDARGVPPKILRYEQSGSTSCSATCSSATFPMTR